MLFYVIRVFLICIAHLSNKEKLLLRLSDLAWIPLNTCVYAR